MKIDKYDRLVLYLTSFLMIAIVSDVLHIRTKIYQLEKKIENCGTFSDQCRITSRGPNYYYVIKNDSTLVPIAQLISQDTLGCCADSSYTDTTGVCGTINKLP